jgi:spermidine synthase
LSAKSAGRKPAKNPPKATPTPAKGAGARSAIMIGVAGAAVVAAVVGFLVWQNREPDIALAAGTEPGVVAQVESLYNDIYVYRRPNGFYVLSFGAERLRYTESVVNPDDELDLPVYYTQSMTAGLAYAPGLEDAAIIGLGGGRTAWYHHKSVPELDMVAVELDPAVAQIADQFFSVRDEDNFKVDVLDGRMWLAKSDRKFDIVMVDAYRGPFVPFHLLTTEFYELVGEHLKPGGVVVQNVEPSTMLFDSAVATIRSAFDHLVFFEGHGNIVILAYNGPEKDEAELQRIAAERQATYGFRYPLPDILARRYTPDYDTATQPLTDDFAPVEYLKAIERHNEKRT